MKRDTLIGKIVNIVDKESMYYGEWGRVIDFDGEYYTVAIADGTDSAPIFLRSEFRVKRK